jgi:hypothetical protein
MNRSDPTFREQTLIAQDNIDFLDELFNNLLDSDDLSSSTDKIPDLSILDS